ncbi:MAG: alpha/beta fold hydrolase [Rhodocyclales bacterium]|nr:alpha/beta fold hydrolase [Rhodocyclales bacterium]
MRITTVILVHGAWHGAWCWQALIPELLKRRLAPFTLDLPAHGVHARFPEGWGGDTARFAVSPAPTSGVTLDDYANAVLEMVDAAVAAGSGPVMLVGHSMAGIALTAVAERAPAKIGLLAYLAAFMPLPGVPMIDYVRCAENAGEEVAGLFVAPPPKIGAMRIDYRNADPRHGERIRSAFAHDVDATSFAAMNHLLTPDVPAAPVATPTVATRRRWGRVPRAYIRCSEDRAVMPALQDRFIREADGFTPGNATRVLTLAASHSPFLSMPEQLAQALADLAA